MLHPRCNLLESWGQEHASCLQYKPIFTACVCTIHGCPVHHTRASSLHVHHIRCHHCMCTIQLQGQLLQFHQHISVYYCAMCVLLYTIALLCILLYTIALLCILQYTIALLCILLYTVALLCILQYTIALLCILLYTVALLCILRYTIALLCILLYTIACTYFTVVHTSVYYCSLRSHLHVHTAREHSGRVKEVFQLLKVILGHLVSYSYSNYVISICVMISTGRQAPQLCPTRRRSSVQTSTSPRSSWPASVAFLAL